MGDNVKDPKKVVNIETITKEQSSEYTKFINEPENIFEYVHKEMKSPTFKKDQEFFAKLGLLEFINKNETMFEEEEEEINKGVRR